MTQRDLWNERYQERGTLWGIDPNAFVVDRLAGLSPRRVLDLGSGQGRNAVWLARQGHRVTAVDISDVATEQARELAAAAGVDAEFIAADVEEWEPVVGAYDVVLLAYLQLPGTMRKALHAKAGRALRPGGRVLIVAHHRDNLEHGVGGPPMAEVLFTEEELAADFPGYTILENRPMIRRVDRGETVGDAIDIVFMADKPE